MVVVKGSEEVNDSRGIESEDERFHVTKPVGRVRKGP